jgi:hypothetical protein
MKQCWLIISYFANIDAMAPSHHIDDRLPYFHQKGIDIQLMTSPCGAAYNNLSHMRIPSLAPSGIRYEVRYFLRRKTRTRFWFKFWETLLLLPVIPFYFLEKAFIRLDTTWSWFVTASIAATFSAVKNRPAILYSTGGPVSAHIAAMVASFLTKIPHIAEFQDPLVHQYAAPGKFERHFIRKVERFILKTAAVSVFLTEQAALNAGRRNPEAKKTAALYAGAVPPVTISPYAKGEKFTVAHFGSLGGSRNLEHFFRALTMLFDGQPELSGSFRLSLYGNSSRSVGKQIEDFIHRETVHVFGKVRRQEAVEFMQRVDVLLLIQNTDDVSFETIPSKVYEYLETGRPILALLYRNPELQAILEGMGHIAVQADDQDGIKKGLETYRERWRKDQLQCFVQKSPFTVERAVEGLISLAKGIIKDTWH